jgi:hypothetical protein
MDAFAIPDARDRLNTAVDALLDESIDGFSTHALGADLIDIRRAADRLEAEFLRRLDRFDSARSLRHGVEDGRLPRASGADIG